MKILQKPMIILFITAAMLMTTIGCVDVIGKEARIDGSGNVIKQEFNVTGFNGVHLATFGNMHITFGNKTELIVEAEDNIMPYLEASVKGGVLKIDIRDNYSLRPKKTVSYYLTVPSLNLIRASSSGDIEVPDIDIDNLEIYTSSSGNIYAKNIRASALEVHSSSSGNVEAEDIYAVEAKIRVSSSGTISVREIQAPSLNARISSSGDVFVSSLDADEIIARISSSGNMEVEEGSVASQNINLSSSGDYRAQNLESDSAAVKISSSGDAYVYVKQRLDARLSGSGSVYYSGDPMINSRETSSGDLIKSE